MGLLLDDRVGSKELAPLFTPFGLELEVKRLPFGDIAFEGNGPNGKCAVVIERKRIGDLIQSITSKRLSGHQMPGMADMYDYCYLIVEGIWRPGPEGSIQIGQGSMGATQHYGGAWSKTYGRGMQYAAVDNYLATLELHAGVIYRRTMTDVETVITVVDLYKWWSKRWWGHSSHLGVYAPAEPVAGRGRLNLARRKVSLAERWAMQIDGVDAKGQAIAEHFGSARALANGTVEDWDAIKGISKLTAERVVGDIGAEI